MNFPKDCSTCQFYNRCNAAMYTDKCQFYGKEDKPQKFNFKRFFFKFFA